MILRNLSILEILYCANRVYLWCVFASNPIVLIKGNMNTRRNAAGRLEEKVSNAGAPTNDEKLSPLEENANIYQAPTNPPPMTKKEMRDILDQMDKARLLKYKPRQFMPKL